MASDEKERSVTSARSPTSRSRMADVLKVGKYRYLYRRLDRIIARLDLIDTKIKIIFTGLKGLFHFDKDYIIEVCCRDGLDRAVLNYLYEAGSGGVFAVEVVAALKERRVRADRWKVSRRLTAMQKAGREATGERVLERLGRRWRLTSFAYAAWRESDRTVGADQEEEVEDRDMEL